MYVAERKSDVIKCWDLRGSGEVVWEVERKGGTNQRIGFGVEGAGRWICSGDTVGFLFPRSLLICGR